MKLTVEILTVCYFVAVVIAMLIVPIASYYELATMAAMPLLIAIFFFYGH